jgi:hypothetical protein
VVLAVPFVPSDRAEYRRSATSLVGEINPEYLPFLFWAAAGFFLILQLHIPSLLKSLSGGMVYLYFGVSLDRQSHGLLTLYPDLITLSNDASCR